MPAGYIYMMKYNDVESYTKIGYAANPQRLLKQLNADEEPFGHYELLATYEIPDSLSNNALHDLLLDQNLDMSYDVNKEIYSIHNKKALAWLKSLAAISQTENRVKIYSNKSLNKKENSDVSQKSDSCIDKNKMEIKELKKSMRKLCRNLPTAKYICIDKIADLTGKKPQSIKLNEDEMPTKNNSDMLVQVCEYLHGYDSVKLEEMARLGWKPNNMKGNRIRISNDKDKLFSEKGSNGVKGRNRAKQIGDFEIYVDTCLEANKIIKVIMALLEEFDIDKKQVFIKL